jgi:hypothetical protein
MREIIYIQAGSLPNYAGTHCWNTQESYFTYDEDHVSVADFSISFKEGRDIYVRQPACDTQRHRIVDAFIVDRKSLLCVRGSSHSITNVRLVSVKETHA